MNDGRPPAARAAGRGGGPLGALATVGLTLLGAYLALELWRSNLTVPFRYAQVDDTKFYFGLVKGIVEHGWYQHNPNLGAPFGQALYDFPQGADNLNFVLIKAISLFSSNYALITNLFFLLTFPLTGLAAYCALRRLGVGPSSALVCSVLFALLPYHFYRHESQVLLSAYYAVPLGAYLFVSLFGDAPLIARRRTGPRALAWLSRRSIETIAICVVIGSAGLYYAVFSLLLLLGGTLIALVARRGRRAVAGALVGAALGLTLAVNLSPSLLYSARHGSNKQIVRTAFESEQLGLRISNLVLPVRGHRLPALSGVNARYAAETNPGYCESCNATLGAVGTIGFVLLCLIGLAACAGAVTPSVSGRPDWQRSYRPAALGVGIALAIGTTGGVSALIAFLITPDVRGWNRISLFIAFFSLLAIGLLLDAALGRLRRRSGRAGRHLLSAALLVSVLALGGLDETSNYFVVDYSAAAREYASDTAFGRAIQARLPSGASVLELPYLPFPEGYHVPGQSPATPFSTSYELLRPYLNTHGLRWSFGAVKGRPSDWEQALAAQPLDVVVAAAAAAGFQAIYVDPHGYDAATGPRVLSALAALLAVRPLASPARDVWLFDLRPYVRQLEHRVPPAVLAAARQATLHPLRTGCAPTPADLTLINPAATPRSATLRAILTGPLYRGVTLQITFPDGSVERRAVGAARLRLRRRLVVAPGTSLVHFSVLGPLPAGASPATPAFVVSDVTLTDRALDPLVSPAGGSAAPPVAGLLGATCAALYALSPAAHLPFAYPPRPTARRAF